MIFYVERLRHFLCGEVASFFCEELACFFVERMHDFFCVDKLHDFLLLLRSCNLFCGENA